MLKHGHYREFAPLCTPFCTLQSQIYFKHRTLSHPWQSFAFGFKVWDVLKHGHYREFAPLCTLFCTLQSQIRFQHANYPKPLLVCLLGLCIYCVLAHWFCGSPVCCDLRHAPRMTGGSYVTYYVRGVSLGTPLTSFRASNSNARFSCLTTSHSLTVAVVLVKNVYQTFFYCEPPRMTGERDLRHLLRKGC